MLPSASSSSSAHADTEDIDVEYLPIDSHLASAFSNDMFAPLFSSVFSVQSNQALLSDETSWRQDGDSREVSDENQFPSIMGSPSNYDYLNNMDLYGYNLSSIFSQPPAEVSAMFDLIQASTSGDLSSSSDPLPAELEHYRKSGMPLTLSVLTLTLCAH